MEVKFEILDVTEKETRKLRFSIVWGCISKWADPDQGGAAGRGRRQRGKGSFCRK
jgi:hypothetical protein